MTLPPPVTSRTNSRVKALRAAFSGKASRPGDLLGMEGVTLIGEAHVSGLHFETIYVREGSEPWLDALWPASIRTRDWMLLSRDVFDSAVDTASPQGVAATWLIAEPVRVESRGCVLVLEDVQDPGNVGTLIRSAEAFGATVVMVTPSTASPWNPKVIRASAGSVFRMPVVRLPIEEIATALRRDKARLFAAVAGFQSKVTMAPPRQFMRPSAQRKSPPHGHWASLSLDADLQQPCAILIGNEGAGLSERALALADEWVQIPCAVESLNAAVAGSVLLYEALRQLPLRDWAQRAALRPGQVDA